MSGAPELIPIYRDFRDSLANALIGHAATERDAVRIAAAVGVKGLTGGRPKLFEYIGGRMWLLED
jgi:hypothetical protein